MIQSIHMGLVRHTWVTQFSILNLQYVKTGLSYDVDFLFMLRHPKKQQIDSVNSRILTVWSLLFGPNILSANQTGFMYNLSRWLNVFYTALDISALWLKPTEYVLVTDGFRDYFQVSLKVKLIYTDTRRVSLLYWISLYWLVQVVATTATKTAKNNFDTMWKLLP